MIQELRKPNVQGGLGVYEFFCHIHIGDTDYEFLGVRELDDHYCGPSRNKPKESFKPMVNVKLCSYTSSRDNLSNLARHS